MDPFKICLTRPYRLKQNSSLIIDKKNVCAVNHPNDLHADNIGGALVKNNKVRFYQIIKQDDKIMGSWEYLPKNFLLEM